MQVARGARRSLRRSRPRGPPERRRSTPGPGAGSPAPAGGRPSHAGQRPSRRTPPTRAAPPAPRRPGGQEGGARTPATLPAPSVSARTAPARAPTLGHHPPWWCRSRYRSATRSGTRSPSDVAAEAGRRRPGDGARRRLGTCQGVTAPATCLRVLDEGLVSGSSTRLSVVPAVPSCLPGPRPERIREDCFGAGLANGASEDGGLEEFDESLPSCRSGSATRATSPATCTACCSTNAVNAAIVASFADSRSSNSSRVGSPLDSTPQSLSIKNRPGSTDHHPCWTAT